MTRVSARIPVIDLFAGPGGLGEGFESFVSAGHNPFRVALSIEKDPFAYRTLKLRAGVRLLTRRERARLYGRLDVKDPESALAAVSPAAAKAAQGVTWQIELGQKSAAEVRKRVGTIVPSTRPWVLVGGPPCQAYSVIGRVRNRGVKGYDSDTDTRQTLYVEYLQILADHAPPVFVMENVKGLLSARHRGHRIFERILEDLSRPAAALRREGRSCAGNPRYVIRPFVEPSEFTASVADPKAFVVQAERFGIPQKRHRVLLLGILEGLPDTSVALSPASAKRTVERALKDLPRIRSGLTDRPDSDASWVGYLREVQTRSWLDAVDTQVRKLIRESVSTLSAPASGRGAEIVQNGRRLPVLNHSARGHISQDLERYLFASCFAETTGVAPRLSDFPAKLLPQHRNVRASLANGDFEDRFRVQVAHEPSSTITSHIAKDGHYFIHFDPRQCRSLTVREAARLQTFPDDYCFTGPRTAQYQQVGNAVPPELARQLAACVAGLI